MLVDFFDRQAALSSQRARLVAGINQLAQSFRTMDQPVIWVRQEFRPDLSDGFLEMKRHGIKVAIAGTEGCRILPELEQSANDHVIVKKRYSAFFGTPLDDLLATLKPGTLVLAGVNTHACVRSTVIDAYQRDYDVILASDCIGSHDEEHHHVTVRYLNGKMAYLLNNADIIRLLSSHGQDSAAGTTEEQDRVCMSVGVTPDPPASFQKVGIALETLHLEPLNGLRHPEQGELSGWFIWGGDELSQASDFFKPLHVAYVAERCPAAVKYLALPAGWRFLTASGQEDVWLDPALLDVS